MRKYAQIVPLKDFLLVRGQLGKIVCTSGGFDPIHSGHTSTIIESKKYGDTLVIIVNGDEYLNNKKGKPFMCLKDRCEVIACIRGVDYVIPYENQDDFTVSEAIRLIEPSVFTKGGDRKTKEEIPEWETCKEMGIDIKINVGKRPELSSTNLLFKWVAYFNQAHHNQRGE